MNFLSYKCANTQTHTKHGNTTSSTTQRYIARWYKYVINTDDNSSVDSKVMNMFFFFILSSHTMNGTLLFHHCCCHFHVVELILLIRHFFCFSTERSKKSWTKTKQNETIKSIISILPCDGQLWFIFQLTHIAHSSVSRWIENVWICVCSFRTRCCCLFPCFFPYPIVCPDFSANALLIWTQSARTQVLYFWAQTHAGSSVDTIGNCFSRSPHPCLCLSLPPFGSRSVVLYLCPLFFLLNAI